MRDKIFLLAGIIAVSIGFIGCSSNNEKDQEYLDALNEYEGNMDSFDNEYTDEKDQEYLDALNEYEGNIDSFDNESTDEIDDHPTEELVMSNGLKELSREVSFSDNEIHVVLDGEIGHFKNFTPTIIKEAEYFMENYKKFAEYEFNKSYKSVTIYIVAEDMSMFSLFYYGESDYGKLIIFDNQSNTVHISEKLLDNDVNDEWEYKDDEFTALLENIGIYLSRKYGNDSK